MIVGLPRTLADRNGPSAQDAIGLAEDLARRVAPTPVRMADERLTTVTAQRSLREAGVRARGQKAMIDQAAAVGILQSWLDQRRGQLSTRSAMPDAWDRERPQPVAVGPPRRRLSRADRHSRSPAPPQAPSCPRRHAVRVRRDRGRRGVPGFAAVAQRFRRRLRLLRGRQVRRRHPGARRGFDHSNRTDARRTRKWSLPPRLSSTAAYRIIRRCRPFSPASTRCAPRFRARDAVTRLTDPQNRVGKLRHPRGPSAGRHPGRQDQQRHRRHLHVDLERDVCGSRR